LDYKTHYLHFLEIPQVIGELVPQGLRCVPCITDVDGKSIQDSRKIALYLEGKYPSPSIFHGGVGIHFFFDDWCMQNIVYSPFRMTILKLFHELDEEAQVYYRKSREDVFKQSLEDYAGDREEHLQALNKQLALVAKSLANYDYLTGDKPGWADICLASYIIMLEKFDPVTFYNRMINQDQNLEAWWNRMKLYADYSH
jgi:glutathione S-transferase